MLRDDSCGGTRVASRSGVLLSTARLYVAATFVLVAPFFLLIPGGLGVACASTLVLLAWCTVTGTTIEPAIYVLAALTFLVGWGDLPVHEKSPNDGVLGCVIVFGAALGVSMLISACTGRIRLFAIARFLRAGLARLFATPGTHGTVHARWFVLGFWLAFLIIAAHPANYAQAHYLKCWLLAFFMMWAVRWFVPRWEPARLARLSLVVSAQPLLYYLTPPDLITIRYSPLTHLPIACTSIAAIWGVAEFWRDWRILSGRHPYWIPAERKGERRLLRQRAVQAGYREPTQGSIVGSLPHRSPLGTEVCVALVFTVAFQFFKLLLW